MSFKDLKKACAGISWIWNAGDGLGSIDWLPKPVFKPRPCCGTVSMKLLRYHDRAWGDLCTRTDPSV